MYTDQLVTKALGIDYGSKRVGLAIGDGKAKIASPLITLTNDNKLVAQIKQVCGDNQIETLVVGLPRGLEGQETAQSWVIRRFGTVLEKQVGLPVVYQDEAVTSELAEERLRKGRTKLVKPADIDKEAASIILQDYLDQL